MTVTQAKSILDELVDEVVIAGEPAQAPRTGWEPGMPEQQMYGQTTLRQTAISGVDP